MISVITITYNNFEELKATLESLRSCASADLIESIVINGGSCQRTREYLETYSGKFLNEPDRGIADAFNKGLSLATGTAVQFLNSGDLLIDPLYLAEVQRRLQSFDFVHSDIVFEDAIAGDLRMKPTMGNLGRGMPYFHQSMVVNRQVFDQVGGFDLHYKIAMDYDFVVRMHKQGARGSYYSDEPTIRMDGVGVSATAEIQSIQECKLALVREGMWSLENRLGLAIRVTGYYFRSFLGQLGLTKLLGFLKRCKRRLC